MEALVGNYTPRLAKDLGQEEDPYDYYYDDPDNLENP
uniref:Uncharacterized protein n=1 Tax=Oryza sativa subsp. japonica TaxID=39947 RepID=Q33A38_ORYSJ|nr:hypothetical protein LOC_Os10g16419 [Oryza sativa Japonica Group]